MDELKPSYDEYTLGVKKFGSMRKNANSVDNYHILNNLTPEQAAAGVTYDGVTKNASFLKTTNQELVQTSERHVRR